MNLNKPIDLSELINYYPNRIKLEILFNHL